MKATTKKNSHNAWTKLQQVQVNQWSYLIQGIKNHKKKELQKELVVNLVWFDESLILDLFASLFREFMLLGARILDFFRFLVLSFVCLSRFVIRLALCFDLSLNRADLCGSMCLDSRAFV